MLNTILKSTHIGTVYIYRWLHSKNQ